MKNKKRFIVSVVLILAAAAYLGFPYVKSITAGDQESNIFYGTAEAEQIDISTEISGKIKEIKVQEGQLVEAGSLLAIIDAPENRIKAEQSEITVESASNELAKTEEGSRDEEINIQKALVRQNEAALEQAAALVEQSEQNVKTAQKAYELNKSQYDDLKILFENGAATREDMENAEYALDTAAFSVKSADSQLRGAQAQLKSAEAQLTAAQEKLRMLQNGAAKRDINAFRYNAVQAEKGLELSKLVLGKSMVTAAKGGVVEMLNFSEGEYVSVGSPLMTITDPNDLWVKIYVPEKILPKLKVGELVSITCEYLEGKTIKGQISYISPEAEFTPLNIVTKEDRLKLVFAVKVKILDNLDSIKPGMLLDVHLD